MNEQGSLFGTPAPSGPGPLEQAVRTEIEHKIDSGLMDRELYAGQIAQAIMLAGEVDKTVGVGRPSGRAQIHDVLHRLLFELPQPEAAPTSSDLHQALEAIMDKSEAER